MWASGQEERTDSVHCVGFTKAVFTRLPGWRVSLPPSEIKTYVVGGIGKHLNSLVPKLLVLFVYLFLLGGLIHSFPLYLVGLGLLLCLC